jgi:L-rhamnose 1-dehydrogenase
MDRFTAKVALVTGGSRGIGRGIVEAFAREGASVVIAHSGRTTDEADALVRQIGLERALAIGGDVADARAVAGIIDQAIARFGRIDVLVNNAGICPFTEFFDLTVEEFDRVQAVNTRSIFLMTQAAARHMRPAGGGAVVNVTSISGERMTNPLQLAYCTSKAAANMLTRALAVALAPHHIRVNAVLPGTIPTDINRDILAADGVQDAILRATPLRKLGRPEDVAAAVLYLASPEADWVTGTLLTVDGGYTA